MVGWDERAYKAAHLRKLLSDGRRRTIPCNWPVTRKACEDLGKGYEVSFSDDTATLRKLPEEK